MWARRGMIRLALAAAVFNALAASLMGLAENISGGDRGAMLFFGPLIVGVLCGEVGAMACWLVWGEGSFLRRLAVHWGIGLAISLCLLCGFLLVFAFTDYVWEFRRIFYAAAGFGCVLPTASLSAQLPLWPSRTHFGWRVARTERDETSGNRQPLSIRDILTGTAVVAVSLGLVRLFPRILSSRCGCRWRFRHRRSR
jgi:hypothetical protein